MNQNYLLKHWLTTILLAPFLLSVYDWVIEPIPGKVIGLIEIYPVFLLFAFVLSLPTVIVYYFTFRLLMNRNANPVLTKIALITLTVVGTATTILIIGGSLSKTLAFAYSATAIVTGCTFKIKKAPAEV